MKTPYDKSVKVFLKKYYGHMTKMTVMSMYGKKPFKIRLLQKQKASDLGTWYVALGMRDQPSLILS